MVWAKQEKFQVYNVVLQPTEAHPTCSSCLQGKLVQKASTKTNSRLSCNLKRARQCCFFKLHL